MITRMLLASVLAIGASSFAGCGDGDCPSNIVSGSSCSSEGLGCLFPGGGGSCTCNSGEWSCTDDMPYVLPHDMARHDLALPDEGPPGD